jgi:hypothetical protein
MSPYIPLELRQRNRQRACAAIVHADLAGAACFSINVWFGPKSALYSRADLALRIGYRAFGTNPAANTAINAAPLIYCMAAAAFA